MATVLKLIEPDIYEVRKINGRNKNHQKLFLKSNGFF